MRRSWLGACLVVCSLGGPTVWPSVASGCGGWLESPTPGLSTQSQLLGISEITPTDVWAVGLTNSPVPGASLAEHFSGSSWSVVSPATAGFLWSVDGAAANDVWAVGDIGSFEHWNGAAWSSVAIPLPKGGSEPVLRDVESVSATDVWAVGWYTANGTGKTLVEHWDGTSWTRIASPNQGRRISTQLWGVAVRSGSDVWVVGRYVKAGEYTFSAHWNGSSWSTPAMPASPSTSETYLGNVVTVGTAGTWAVGSSGNAGALVERYSAGAWHIVTAVADVDFLHGLLAFAPKNIYASGSKGGEPIVEHWDGTMWSAVPTPTVLPAANGLWSLDGASPTDIWGAGDQGGTPSPQTLVEHYC